MRVEDLPSSEIGNLQPEVVVEQQVLWFEITAFEG